MTKSSDSTSRITRRHILKGSALSIATWMTPRFMRKTVSADTPWIVWMWCGALTDTSVRINVQLSADTDNVQLLVSTDEDLDDPIFELDTEITYAENKLTIGVDVTGLQPDTDYLYGVRIDGVKQPDRGKFRTAKAGPFSFKVAFGSCAQSGSNHAVFETIRQHNPLLFVNTGDLFYGDIVTDSVEDYYHAFRTVFSADNQQKLYGEVPIAYMWDDHDYGNNKSDKTSPSRRAARLAYQGNVPHYPLAEGSGDVGIYQAFTIGRVRFILTDSRSKRSPVSEADTGAKSLLGWTQKLWLKSELLDARDSHSAIVWFCTTPWLADEGSDTWHRYQTERREIADYIENNQIDNLCFISGDIHMLAIDDGSNNTYSTSGSPSFPIMQAAALDQTGYYLPNTTFSEGQFPGRGQFGVMEIIDDGIGNPVSIKWRGRNYLNQEIVGYDFTLDRKARIGISQPTLNFTVNSATGSTTESKALVISNLTDIGPFSWQISTSNLPSWLTLSSTSGSGSKTITVTVNASGMSIGVHQASIQVYVAGASNTPTTIPVQMLHTDQDSLFLPILTN